MSHMTLNVVFLPAPQAVSSFTEKQPQRQQLKAEERQKEPLNLFLFCHFYTFPSCFLSCWLCGRGEMSFLNLSPCGEKSSLRKGILWMKERG